MISNRMIANTLNTPINKYPANSIPIPTVEVKKKNEPNPNPTTATIRATMIPNKTIPPRLPKMVSAALKYPVMFGKFFMS